MSSKEWSGSIKKLTNEWAIGATWNFSYYGINETIIELYHLRCYTIPTNIIRTERKGRLRIIQKCRCSIPDDIKFIIKILY